MSSCANCDKPFMKKPGGSGYHRFSLERDIEGSGESARQQLENITGSCVTPRSKRTARFLCPQCWNRLRDTTKYRQSLDHFFGSTHSSSYVASKRQFDSMQPSNVTESTPSSSYGASKRQSPETMSFKRPRFTSTPLKSKTSATKLAFGKSTKKSKWDTIITAIRARQYRRAIFGLFNATKSTKRHFTEVAARIVRSEMKQLINIDMPLCNEVNIASIANFSWAETIDAVSVNAPLLFSVVRGSVTTKKNEDSLMRASVNLKPRIGTILSLLMHNKAPRKSKFLPTLFSVQFWRGRLKRETIKQLSRLGICVGYEATLSAIDKIRSDFDSAALKLKADMEEILSNNKKETVADELESDIALALSMSVTHDDMEEEMDTVLYSDNDADVSCYENDDHEDQKEATESESEDEVEGDSDGSFYELIDDEQEDDIDIEIDEEIETREEAMELSDIMLETSDVDADIQQPRKIEHNNQPPGFSMCWDNVGKKVITRHPTENSKNKYINMALGYIAVNRVNSLHASRNTDDIINAKDLPLNTFIPGQKDIDHLRSRMIILTGRIITRHLKWFNEHFNGLSVPHIAHEYSLQSTWKSVLINLGVFDENPCSTQGAIGIYERLQRYVPTLDGVPHKTIVYGDGLSCERGNDAQRARANGLNPTERLQGLEPAAQEFHKEMLLLQDFYDDFFKGASASDRGTLCQLKNLFNFRQVKGDISDNFTHAWELMCLVVEGFISLLTMKVAGLNEVADRPSNAPADIESADMTVKRAYLENTCQAIVDRVWQTLDTDRLKNDDGTGPPVICCGEDVDEDFIGCDCRSSCPNGEFFHYSCAGIDPEHIPVPWYCCDECRHRTLQPYQYCVCKRDLGTDEPMIGCHAEVRCTKFEWYHMRCLNINPKCPPKGAWYFSDECRRKCKGKAKSTSKKTIKDTDDHVLNYSLALIWRGLNLLCRRDAVREADGEAMISFWKFDLIHFFGNKHPKYTILAHRLLASVNGWLPEHLRFDLMHNRTVNYGGGIGRNLPLDFMNEILNRLFKDLLESAKGRYTDTTIQRCSQIVGPLGEALDNVFDSNVVENELYRHRRRAHNRDENVLRLVHFLNGEELFEKQVGRRHNAFADFSISINPKQAGKFPSKMKQLSKRLDKLKRVIINE